MPGSKRLFNALTGDEAKQVILNEIKRELDNHQDFKSHLVFPQITWEWTLRCDIYPREPENLRLKSEGVLQQKDFMPNVDTEHKEVELGFKTEVRHPDKLRELENLPVPVAQHADTGQVVDVPMDTYAKRVTIGTRANPRGPVVNPTKGEF